MFSIYGSYLLVKFRVIVEIYFPFYIFLFSELNVYIIFLYANYIGN